MFYQNSHPDISVGTGGNTLLDMEHFHKEIELIFCVEGSFKAYIDSKEYLVEEGYFSCVFPNQKHSYIHCEKEPRNYRACIFNTNITSELERYFLTALPVNPILKINNKEYVFDLLDKMFELRNSSNEFEVLKRNAYCKLLIAELFQNCDFVYNKRTDSEILNNIIEFCNNNFANDIHLSDLEKNLHINKFYISHIFKDKIGMGFNEYINSLRISAACKLLYETDETITEIAFNVGYNTVRNFNRIFLKVKKVTPKQYRETKIKAKESK